MKKLTIIVVLVISLFACSESKITVVVDTTEKAVKLKDTVSNEVDGQHGTSITALQYTTSATIDWFYKKLI